MISPSLYSQTLTGVNLNDSQIGDIAAQYLADALRDNKVFIIFSTSLSHMYLSFYSQTLTTLELGRNQIGDVGAQYLADALRDNNVILIFLTRIPHIYLSLSIYRHSLRWTLASVESELLVFSTSLMPYGRTKWFSGFLHLSLISIFYPFTDTHHLGLWKESNRRGWSSISRWYLTREPGDSHFLHIFLSFLPFASFTDNHQAISLEQSNQRCWSSIYG